MTTTPYRLLAIAVITVRHTVPGNDWEKNGKGKTFYLHIRRNGSAGGFELKYQVGSGIANKLDLLGVVYTLVSDLTFEGYSFEDFCLELGYDTDSRKALETYLAIQEQNNNMRRVFSSEDIETLTALVEDY